MLEYASPAWNPLYRKDTNELEKVQKKMLKLNIPPIESVPLEQRRIDTDLCKSEDFQEEFDVSSHWMKETIQMSIQIK